MYISTNKLTGYIGMPQEKQAYFELAGIPPMEHKVKIVSAYTLTKSRIGAVPSILSMGVYTQLVYNLWIYSYNSIILYNNKIIPKIY